MTDNSNQNQWDKFANKDAIFYIDTAVKNAEEFWNKGETSIKTYVLPKIQKHRIHTNRCIDFGCGIGRYSFPLAAHFHEVVGVDISEQMLQKAKSIAHEKQISNTRFIHTNDLENLKKPVDFIYSVNVFQHIEDQNHIQEILQNLAKLLNGFAYIQFDTRPQSLLYKIKKLLPDILLPRSQKRGIRRIRREPETIKEWLHKAGFTVIEEEYPQTGHHFFLLQKT